MKIISPRFEIITPLDGPGILKHIELCGRVCYKSEDRMTEASAKDFVVSLIRNGHESVLEHYSFTVRFVCDRGVSHELVRHRIASFSQESTRYCNYGSGEMTFIRPCFLELNSPEDCAWSEAMADAEECYNLLMLLDRTPQEARALLPNSLKTEVIMTANLREWRHFFRLRTHKSAHPQMRELTIPLLAEVKAYIPVVFDDIEATYDPQ